MTFPIAFNSTSCIAAAVVKVGNLQPIIAPHVHCNSLSLAKRSPLLRKVVLSCAPKPPVVPLTDFGFDSDFIPNLMKDTVSLFKEAAEDRQVASWEDSEKIEAIYHNYVDAVNQSGDPSASLVALFGTADVFDLMLENFKDAFEFLSYHKAIRMPIDYYKVGRNYFRPLIDFKNSYIGNVSVFQEIQVKLNKGENVILMSNNQGKADPVFLAFLLESTYPNISENMTYVINSKGFLEDPFYNIFNMGRNLIRYKVPDANRGPNEKTNTHDIVSLLRCGSQIIWFAPSGEMDCLDPVTQDLFPAQFNSSSVKTIRELSERSGIPSHVYPLALLSTNKISSPVQEEKDEDKRIISYHGVGLSVGPMIYFPEAATVASFDDPEVETAYSRMLYDSVSKQYMVLKSAIHENQGISASNDAVSLSQPFIYTDLGREHNSGTSRL